MKLNQRVTAEHLEDYAAALRVESMPPAMAGDAEALARQVDALARDIAARGVAHAQRARDVLEGAQALSRAAGALIVALKSGALKDSAQGARALAFAVAHAASRALLDAEAVARKKTAKT